MESNSAIRGISFQWPNQISQRIQGHKHQNQGPNPVVYPYAIGPRTTLSGLSKPISNVTIENIELFNAFYGIDLTSMVRHTVRNVIGQPLVVGIRIDNVTEPGGLVENVQFVPLWSSFLQSQDPNSLKQLNVKPKTPSGAFQFANGTAFLIQGAVGQRLLNCFCLGYNIGVRVTASAFGSTLADCQFQGLSTDACRTGVQIDAADPTLGLQFTNFFLTGETDPKFPPTNPNGAAIVVTSSFTSHARFTNGVIWGISPSVTVAGSGSAILSSITFNDDQAGFSPKFSVSCTSGTIVVKSCQFLKRDHHVFLDTGVTKAILMGNIAPNPQATTFDVKNQMLVDQQHGEGKTFIILNGDNVPPYTPPP
jgi:hypothetical protein